MKRSVSPFLSLRALGVFAIVIICSLLLTFLYHSDPKASSISQLVLNLFNFDAESPEQPVIKTLYKFDENDEVVDEDWIDIGCNGYTDTSRVKIEWEHNSEPEPEPVIEKYIIRTKTGGDYDQFDLLEQEIDLNPGNNPYWFTVIAVDTSDNESEPSEKCFLIYDEKPPSIYLFSPLDESFWNEPISIHGYASSQSEVTQVNVLYRESGSEPWIHIESIINVNQGRSVFEFGSTWSPEQDGVYDVRIESFDQNTSVPESVIEIYDIVYDTTPPEVDFIPPQRIYEGDDLLNQISLISHRGVKDEYLDTMFLDVWYKKDYDGNKEFLDAFEIPINDIEINYLELTQLIINDKLGFSPDFFPIDTSIMDEGIYTVYYYVTDKAGNRSDSSVDIIVVNRPPLVHITKNQIIEIGEKAKLEAWFEDQSYLEYSHFYSGANIPDDGPWNITIDYNDGHDEKLSMDLPGDIEDAFKEFNYEIDHIYTTEDTYTVTIEVCENKFVPPMGFPPTDPPQEEIDKVKGDGQCNNDSVTITVITEENEEDDDDDEPLIDPDDPNEDNSKNPPNNNPDNNSNQPDHSNQTPPPAQPNNQPLYIPPHNPEEQQEEDIIAEVKDDKKETEDEVEVDSDQNGEILGEHDCNEEDKSKVSGYIFYDVNTNEQRDDDEQGLGNIEVKIYSEEDSTLIEQAVSGSNGYFELSVCPGTYVIKLVDDNLPENSTLIDEAEKTIIISKGNDLLDLNFRMQKQASGINWKLCFIPLGIAGLLLLLSAIISTLRKEQ